MTTPEVAWMARFHLIRIGTMGTVGRFASVDGTRFPRGSQVVVRTARGLETGEVLAPPDADESETGAAGTVLRGMTIEDQLLDARLEKNRLAAYEACQARLQQLQSDALLMDVEHLFDGETLVFHFLGPIPPDVEAMTAELAELYDARAQFRAFVDTVTRGCGPDCGTDQAEGGCGNCATGCAVSAVCQPRRAL